MKLDKKGQALIEFVIILPIFLFILFAIIDFGIIGYNNNKLENMINDVGNMYKNKESVEEINEFIKKNDKKISVNFINEDKYFKIVLKKEYEFITPGLSSILKDFSLKTERTMYNG